ncbi:MAG TPA: T9SS type A sorting domain-containing protein, partial [Paludibacter sp.]|nr:T9SS type A sorting domain-containing protein [Paludibacter sp.]
FHNPICNVLNICFTKVQRGYLFLFDTTGNCVLKSSINNQTNIRVSMKGVPAGVYTLQVDGYYQKVIVA